MRHAAIAMAIAALALMAAIEAAAATRKADFATRVQVIEWIDGYRHRPEPQRLPAAVRTLSESGALRDPEAAGYYVGFAAGVLGANPREAEQFVQAMLPLPPADQWFAARAIAYSGLPAWQSILARTASKLPARRGMVDAYLAGKLPALDTIALDKSPTFLEKVGEQFGVKQERPAVSFAQNPELLDTLWGRYFASGEYRALWRIVTMLRWSKDRDSAERLAIGSSAKYTLANNAARYPDVLATLREMAPQQDKETRPVLAEVIRAAETVQTSGIRKEQLAALEKLKTKGAGYQRDMKLWGYAAQGAIGVGCIVAATLSFTVAGLPCVIGGAVASAGISYWAATQ
ncbi:MAG: hypothetical protein K2Z80_19220 [Xanthobacteraceae bacterium]|nr:hypothetical protein [Xanthobacteraceae bacterium]